MAARFLSACFLLFLLLYTTFPCAAASPPLVLYANTEPSPLSGHLDILEDNAGKLTVDDVSAPAMASQFRSYRQAVPFFGGVSVVYWLRFTIGNQGAAAQPLLLELDAPFMDYLDLYAPRPGGGFEHMLAGTRRPMSIRAFAHRNAIFPVVADTVGTTFFLRVHGPIRKIFPLTAWPRDVFNHMDHRRDMFAGCYFGAILVMCAYHFFLFLSLRDRNYLYYILDIFSFGLFEFASKGFVIEFFTAEMPLLNQYVFAIGALSIFCSLLFVRSFLATGRNVPAIDRIIKLLMLAALLIIPAMHLLPTEGCKSALAVIAISSSLIALIAGVVCMSRGYHPARYYLGARVFRFIGILVFALAVFNVLPKSVFTYFAMQIGSILEMIFLSFALADRIAVMQREKEEAQADAIRSSHLASLGELAAGVAHEINNPVNTIINSADLILESDDRAENQHDADVIKKHGRRIATIVSSLLFFARRPAQEKTPFAMAELLDGTLDMIGARLSKDNITITGQIPPDLPPVLVHPQQIEQVFLNILTNAMHALDEKHGVAYEGKRLDISASELTVAGRPFVRISFHDNGAGIPPELLSRVTESFVTTKQTGNGLGLSICRQIVADHGGYLNIESTVGEYARVSVDLPVAGN